jgi:hypothetical protein
MDKLSKREKKVKEIKMKVNEAKGFIKNEGTKINRLIIRDILLSYYPFIFIH